MVGNIKQGDRMKKKKHKSTHNGKIENVAKKLDSKIYDNSDIKRLNKIIREQKFIIFLDEKRNKAAWDKTWDKMPKKIKNGWKKLNDDMNNSFDEYEEILAENRDILGPEKEIIQKISKKEERIIKKIDKLRSILHGFCEIFIPFESENYEKKTDKYYNKLEAMNLSRLLKEYKKIEDVSKFVKAYFQQSMRKGA